MSAKAKRHVEPGVSLGSLGFRVALAICAVLAAFVSLVQTGDLPVPDESEATPEPVPIHSAVAFTERHAIRSGESSHLAKALEAIQSESDVSKREELLLHTLANLSAAEIPSMLALLENADDSDFANGLRVRLVRRWAEMEPQAASHWVEQLPAGPNRSEALDQVAIAWANLKSSDAIEWARQLPDSGEKNQAVGAVAYEVTRSQPVEAVRIATELPAGVVRDDLLRHAAAEWAMQDATTAIEWTRQIGDETLREQMLAAVATACSDRDPMAAARLATASLPPGRAQSDAVVGIAQRWAQQDPEKAAAWVELFPVGELRFAAVESVASIWAQDDAIAAREWRQHFATP